MDRPRRKQPWRIALPWVGLAAAATLMVAVYFALPLDGLGPQRPRLGWLLFVAALALVAVLLLRQIVDVLTDRPDARPGLVIPLLICLSVLAFSAAYYVLAKHHGEFVGLTTRADALYFTVITLATVGYGDITPRGQSARVVVVVQILYSFVFLTAAATALSSRVRNVLGRRQTQSQGKGAGEAEREPHPPGP